MYSDTLRHYYLMVYCIVYLSRDFHSFPFVCCFFCRYFERFSRHALTFSDTNSTAMRSARALYLLHILLRSSIPTAPFLWLAVFGMLLGHIFFICDECSSWGSSTAMLLVGELHSDAALGGAMRLPLCLSCDLFGFVTCATIFLLKTVD